MSGNARIGSTAIVSPSSKSDSLVLQVRLGRPLTSALHEPHLAALQFQRTARSGASCAWIQWRASRTTIPSSTGTSNSANVPSVVGVPRKTLRWASVIGSLRRDELAQVVRHRREWCGHDLHRLALETGDAVLLRPDRVEVREVEPTVGAATLAPSLGAACDRFRDDEHVADLVDEAPGRVVGATAADPHVIPSRPELGEPADGLIEVSFDPE